MSCQDRKGRKLEDYEPGASKSQVFSALRKASGAKKKPKKSDDSPPEQASS